MTRSKARTAPNAGRATNRLRTVVLGLIGAGLLIVAGFTLGWANGIFLLATVGAAVFLLSSYLSLRREPRAAPRPTPPASPPPQKTIISPARSRKARRAQRFAPEAAHEAETSKDEPT